MFSRLCYSFRHLLSNLTFPVASCPMFSLCLSRLHAVLFPSRSSRCLDPFSVVRPLTFAVSALCVAACSLCLFHPFRCVASLRFSLGSAFTCRSFFLYLHYFAEYGRSHQNVQHKKNNQLQHQREHFKISVGIKDALIFMCDVLQTSLFCFLKIFSSA